MTLSKQHPAPGFCGSSHELYLFRCDCAQPSPVPECGCWQDKDEFLGTNLTHTSSSMIAIRPSLVWQISDRLTMSGSVDILVYRNAIKRESAPPPFGGLVGTSFQASS